MNIIEQNSWILGQNLLRPTASFVFAGRDTLDSRVTFTRASSGTRFNSAKTLVTETNDVARFDHDPSTGKPLGLLIEGPRANLSTFSEDFTQGFTSGVTATITDNQAVAPDGATTADKIEDDSAAAVQQIQKNFTVSDNNDAHTWTIYVEKDSDTVRFPRFQMGIAGGSVTTGNVSLNTSTGEISSASLTSANSMDAGDHWRIDATITNNTSGATTLFLIINPASSATLGGAASNAVTGSTFDWGNQLESATTFPTSYISAPSSSSVTRAADVNSRASVLPANRTVLLKGRTAPGSGTQTLWSNDDGTANERVYVERNSSDEIHVFVVDGGVTQADLNMGVVADNTDFALAFAISAGDFAASLNGGAIVSDTAGTLPTTTTTREGHNHADANHWNGTIALELEWDTRQPNGVLQGFSA